MNSNTICGYYAGTGRNKLLSQTLASTAETAIQIGGDVTNQSALLFVPTTTNSGSSNPQDPNANASILGEDLGRQYGRPNGAQGYSTSSFDLGRPFNLKFIGIGSAAANGANTLTVKIYQGTSGTIGSDTLFSTPISALATASAANLRFYINIQCFWDSTSDTLSGVLSGNYTYNGTTSLITTVGLTSITGITSPTSLGFVPSITWGNAVGGVIAATEFSIEQS
jgi:hypothetical protein